jgi:hypothetical protein
LERLCSIAKAIILMEIDHFWKFLFINQYLHRNEFVT